jgi:glycosyl transferase family 4
VLMMDPKSESGINARLLDEVSPGIRLFAVRAGNPLRSRVHLAVSRLALWLRDLSRRHFGGSGNGGGGTTTSERSSLSSLSLSVWRSTNAYIFFARADDWIRRATVLGRKLHRERPYDLIVSCGPPHMAHIAAQRIAGAAGVPFVVDMRDAMALPEVEPVGSASKVWRRRMSEWERLALSRAALSIANTEELRRALQARYPTQSNRMLTVMNGADPDCRINGARSGTFIIAHTGSMYAGRDPRPLFEAVASLVKRRGLSPTDLSVHFMGETTFEGTSIEQLASQAGISSYVTVESVRERSAVLALLGRSAVLVILPQSISYAIPAKVFEYVQAPAWLLVLAERDSSVAALVRGSDADVIDPSDAEAISEALERRFDAHRRGERPAPLNADGRFDRSKQSEILFDALDRLVPPVSRAPINTPPNARTDAAASST